MPQTGDRYIVELKNTHLGWGEHRHTDTRTIIDGEGYIPIPAKIAREFEIYNANHFNGDDVLGGNIFNCTSSDGSFDGILKAQGNSKAGDVFAKNFSECGDLKGIGSWLEACQASAGDSVEVEWTSSTDIVITLIPA